MHIASWRDAYRGIVSDERLAALDLDERTERWHEYLVDPEVVVRVADDGGEITGFIAARPRTGEIPALYLAPGRIRQGIGSRLLEAAHDALRAAGRGKAVLWVLAGNDAALAFYAANGYAPDGTRDIVAGHEALRLEAAI